MRRKHKKGGNTYMRDEHVARREQGRGTRHAAGSRGGEWLHFLVIEHMFYT
jgi:hypothetical protein